MVTSLASVFGTTAFAASTEDLTYEVVDGKATITGCNVRADGTLIIPENIDGYTVNAIAENAFAMCVALDSVSIPATVVNIGEMAFHSCTSLKSVTVYSKNVDLSLSGIGYTVLIVCPGMENEFENAAFAYVDADKAYTESGYDPALEYDFMMAYFELCNYAEISDSENGVAVDSVVINGYAGSTAETYANNSGFEFSAIDVDEPEVTPDVTPDNEPVTDDNTDNDSGSSDDKVNFEIEIDFDSFSETISNLINTETLYKIVVTILRFLSIIASF